MEMINENALFFTFLPDFSFQCLAGKGFERPTNVVILHAHKRWRMINQMASNASPTVDNTVSRREMANYFCVGPFSKNVA